MYEQLISGIIRPPRLTYHFPRALGPTTISFSDGIECHRTDFEVDNQRGQKLGCSLWLPGGAKAGGRGPCVVYLHGNSSSRVEAVRTHVLNAVMAAGSALVGFDFAGCGNADGDYISLGWFEAHDTGLVLEELQRRGCGPIVLFGRSMGAVTALQYTVEACASSPSPYAVLPAGLILDSPFAGFKRLAYDLTSKGMVHIPRFATAAVLSFIRRSVRHRVGFDLLQLKPSKHVQRCTSVPALFFVAEDDELIPPWHGEILERRYGGPSLGIRFVGSHNTPRPPIVYALASVFIKAVTEGPANPMTVGLAVRLIEKTAVMTREEEEARLRVKGEQEVSPQEHDLGREVPCDQGGREQHQPEQRGHGQQQGAQPRRGQRQGAPRRGPFFYYYEGQEAKSKGLQSRGGALGGGRGQGKGGQGPRNREESPRFIHAGSHVVTNISETAKSLISAWQASAATRMVEAVLLEEVIAVGVAIVQAQLRALVLADRPAEQRMQTKAGANERDATGVAGTPGLVPVCPYTEARILQAVAETQQELALAKGRVRVFEGRKMTGQSSARKPLDISLTTWESVVYAEGQEHCQQTRRILGGFERLLNRPHGPAGRNASDATIPVMCTPSISAESYIGATRREAETAEIAGNSAFATLGTRLCCFNPRDVSLSVAHDKEFWVFPVAEAFLK